MKKRKLNPSHTAVPAPAQMPVLGRQLCITPVRASKVGDGWYKITQSPSQQLRRFAWAFAAGMFFSVIMLAALYLPDFLLDYAHRGQEFMTFFAKFLGIAVLVIGAVAAISAWMRHIVLYVNPSLAKIVSAWRLTESRVGESLALEDCVLHLGVDAGMTRKSRLVAEIHGSHQVLAETMGDNDDLVELRTWLENLG